MASIEIDDDSGFCFGVVTAIEKAEQELKEGGPLYCLGDIVHNSNEVERLQSKGLETITHPQLQSLRNARVLLRAHGEPPATYRMAAEMGITLIDATCPVVLQLQKRIKNAFMSHKDDPEPPLILIYGKPGHAEVNGLVGQTEGTAIVVQSIADLQALDLNRNILLYSQTTKSLDGFMDMVHYIDRCERTGDFKYFDTICRRVAGRIPKIRKFATEHEVIIFVSGRKSSNGQALYEECRKINDKSYFITSPGEIDTSWIEGVDTVGICGATSTPRWLMEQVRDSLQK